MVSLSARRAWIEIKTQTHTVGEVFVALRKESVDRNWFFVALKVRVKLSLSARRAWIEIACPFCEKY